MKIARKEKREQEARDIGAAQSDHRVMPYGLLIEAMISLNRTNTSGW